MYESDSYCYIQLFITTHTHAHNTRTHTQTYACAWYYLNERPHYSEHYLIPPHLY